MKVTIYSSGMSSKSDLIGIVKALKPVGVQVRLLTATTRQIITDYNNRNGRVFIDSGAFTDFRKGVETPFWHVIAEYHSLLKNISNKHLIALVAPDAISDEVLTFKLLTKYKNDISQFINDNVDVIIPVQQGELSLLEGYDRIIKILNTISFLVGIPSNEAAIPLQTVIKFIKSASPARVHFLGLGNKKRLDAITSSLIDHCPELDISADANFLRAKLGVGRKLDQKVKAQIAVAMEYALAHGYGNFPGKNQFIHNIFHQPCYLSARDTNDFARILEPSNPLAQERIVARATGPASHIPGFNYGSRLGDLLSEEYAGSYLEAALNAFVIVIARRSVSGAARSLSISEEMCLQFVLTMS